MTALGYKKDTSSNYVALHILRKHLISQTIAASNDTRASCAAEAEEELQTFSSKAWFDGTTTIKNLRDIVPDEAEYLSTFSSVLRPWQLSRAYIFKIA